MAVILIIVAFILAPISLYFLLEAFFTYGLPLGMDEFICGLLFLTLAFMAATMGRKIIKRGKRFAEYKYLIITQKITSIESLATSNGVSVDVARRDLRKMIEDLALVGARIDTQTNEIIITNAMTMPQSEAKITTLSKMAVILIIIAFILAPISLYLLSEAFFTYGLPLGMEEFIWGSFLLTLAFMAATMGRKIIKRGKRFAEYKYLIITQKITSIESLATSNGVSVDVALRDLHKMIEDGTLFGARIDTQTNEIIFTNAMTMPQSEAKITTLSKTEIVNCSGCGASVTKAKGSSGCCDYCGTVI